MFLGCFIPFLGLFWVKSHVSHLFFLIFYFYKKKSNYISKMRKIFRKTCETCDRLFFINILGGLYKWEERKQKLTWRNI